VPTYEYECSAGHRYEKREGFDALATQRCAKCRRIARRVLHAPSIVFKGSGFYVTDSRKPALSGDEGSAPAGEPETKAESTSAKTESTPAGKDAKAESTPAGKDSKKDAEPQPAADSPSAKAAAS
jgi:putative FmdB family regulatory protein